MFWLESNLESKQIGREGSRLTFLSAQQSDPKASNVVFNAIFKKCLMPMLQCPHVFSSVLQTAGFIIRCDRISSLPLLKGSHRLTKLVHTLCVFKPKFAHTLCTNKAFLIFLPTVGRWSQFIWSAAAYTNGCTNTRTLSHLLRTRELGNWADHIMLDRTINLGTSSCASNDLRKLK